MPESTTFIVQRLDDNIAFYDRMLGAAGWSRFVRSATFCGYAREGDDSGAAVWLCEPTQSAPQPRAKTPTRVAPAMALAA